MRMHQCVTLQVLGTVSGVAGDLGPSVPGPVVEDLSLGGDSVTVPPRNTVVPTVRVIPPSRGNVTLRLAVFKVEEYICQVC